MASKTDGSIDTKVEWNIVSPTKGSMETTSKGFTIPSEEDFLAVCTDLHITKDIEKKAFSQLKLLASATREHEVELPLAEAVACALYMAIVDGRMPYGPLDPQLQCGFLEAPCATVSDILRKANMNVTTFFHRMQEVKHCCNVSESVCYHLLLLEKKYCIVSALYHTFERLFKVVFRDDVKACEDCNEENVMPPIPETEGVMFRKKLCWTLFLRAKATFLANHHDLIQAYLLLLACLEFVLRTTPSFLLNPPYDAVRIGCLQSSEHRTQNMLNVLAEQFDASVEEAQTLQRNCTEHFFQGLPQIDGELDYRSALELCKLSELEGLWRQYEQSYKLAGDLNELLFLKHDALVTPVDYNKNRITPSKSRFVSSQPMTPVRMALNTVAQLKNLLRQASDEPTSKLKEYFENCSSDFTVPIANRLNELKQKFVSMFSSASNTSQLSIAEQRVTMATRLYYQVMESMLNMEHERLSQNDFTSLLSHENFHRSLLAACVEVVLMSYGLSSSHTKGSVSHVDSQFSFPWILEVFDLQAYDFFKVLESFIKAEPKLPIDVIHHLQSVEHRILETIAWREGSSLFTAIEKANGGQITLVEIATSLDPMSPSNHSSSAAEMYLSPMCPSGIHPPTAKKVLHNPVPSASPTKLITKTSPLKSTSNSASSNSPVVKATKRSHCLTLFFNKVCRLGYHRIQKLCAMLQVSKDLQQKVWTCFEFCVTNRPGLVKNRHVDQIMMCSLYAICKVADREIKFKHIVQMYRNLPHSDQDVYKNVYIQEKEIDSIIGFYNKIFQNNMKNYILQFSVNKLTTPVLSPVPTKTVKLTASPVFSVPGRKNFYISPLKESPFKSPPSPSQLTPKTRQLYSFGEGFGAHHKLQTINESLSPNRRLSGTGTPPRSLKRLAFDNPPDDDCQEPPSKIHRVVKSALSSAGQHKMPGDVRSQAVCSGAVEKDSGS